MKDRVGSIKVSYLNKCLIYEGTADHCVRISKGVQGNREVSVQGHRSEGATARLPTFGL
jgi:hypothetical protein